MRYLGHWILDGHVPVKTDDETYYAWAEKALNDPPRVAETTIGEVWVSTIFLNRDHALGDGPPMLFETMIFGGPLDENRWRYSTWEEAEAGHEAACVRDNG